jgi:hypothetical protein
VQIIWGRVWCQPLIAIACVGAPKGVVLLVRDGGGTMHRESRRGQLQRGSFPLIPSASTPHQLFHHTLHRQPPNDSGANASRINVHLRPLETEALHDRDRSSIRCVKATLGGFDNSSLSRLLRTRTTLAAPKCTFASSDAIARHHHGSLQLLHI